jgi:hypothetical protein
MVSDSALFGAFQLFPTARHREEWHMWECVLYSRTDANCHCGAHSRR